MRVQDIMYYDIVVYCKRYVPVVGRCVRKLPGKNIVIVPLKGGRSVKRHISEVIKVADVYERNKLEIKQQTTTLK